MWSSYGGCEALFASVSDRVPCVSPTLRTCTRAQPSCIRNLDAAIAVSRYAPPGLCSTPGPGAPCARLAILESLLRDTTSHGGCAIPPPTADYSSAPLLLLFPGELGHLRADHLTACPRAGCQRMVLDHPRRSGESPIRPHAALAAVLPLSAVRNPKKFDRAHAAPRDTVCHIAEVTSVLPRVMVRSHRTACPIELASTLVCLPGMRRASVGRAARCEGWHDGPAGQ